MAGLANHLLALLGEALGLEPDFFTRHMDHPTYGFTINWYPGREVVGTPGPNRFRIGPHTDFGTVTLLDRQAGRGGPQVFTDADAPVEELMSLVYFGECTPGTVVESVPAPVGRVAYPPVDSHTCLRAKLDSITVD